MSSEGRDSEDLIQRFASLAMVLERTGRDMFEVYKDSGMHTLGVPDRHARVLAEMVLHMSDTLTATKHRIQELQELAARIRQE